MKRRGDKKNFWKNTLLVSVSLILSLAVAEFVLRLLEPPKDTGNEKIFKRWTDEHGIRKHSLIPGGKGTTGGHEVVINSGGLRDFEYQRKKPDNTYRIAVLGDSFTYGSGVPLQDTYPKQMESMLNERGSGVQFEVMNFGIPGYNTEMELERLKQPVLSYQPNLVVIGYVMNDARLYVKGVKKKPHQKNFLTRTIQAIESKSFLLSTLKHHVGALLRMWNVPGVQKYSDMGQYERDYAESSEGWKRTQRALTEAQQESENAGAHFLVVIFPHLSSLNENYPFLGIHKKIKTFCEKNDIPVLDLFPAFKGLSPIAMRVSLRDHHPNREGHRVAADAILKDLTKRNYLP